MTLIPWIHAKPRWEGGRLPFGFAAIRLARLLEEGGGWMVAACIREGDYYRLILQRGEAKYRLTIPAPEWLRLTGTDSVYLFGQDVVLTRRQDKSLPWLLCQWNACYHLHAIRPL